MRTSIALAFLLTGILGAAEPQVHSVYAWADLRGAVHVRWLTAGPAKCELLWGNQKDALNKRVPEDPSCLRGTTNNRDAGTGWATNHRADFSAGKARSLFVSIKGTTREGTAFTAKPTPVRMPPEPKGTVKRARIELKVDVGDWSLPTMPLTFGVPFPPGHLTDEQHVRVLVDGQDAGVQANAVTRWHEDQSIKWLRVRSVVPADARNIVFEYGTEVSSGWHYLGLLPRLEGIEALAAGLRLLDAEGRVQTVKLRDTALEPGRLEQSCRLRGVLADDNGPSGFEVVLRWNALYGAPAQRLDVTLENTRTDQEMSAIQSFSLQLPLKGSLRMGSGDVEQALAVGQRLFQREDHGFVVEPGGAKGKRISGIVRGEDRAVVLRNFWEQWPVAVTAGKDAVTLELCPKLPADFYAKRPDEDKFYYHIRDGKHTFRQGWSKTWHIWLGPAAGAAGFAGDLPVVSVPPEWIENSGALRRIAVSTRDQIPGYDETVAAALRNLPASRDQRREYGMMNFGDWYGERRWNWGNLEYDTGHAWLTQFARTGDPLFQRRAEEAIRHQRDVDTRHYARDPRRVGQQWIHSMGHTAGYYDNEYKHMKRYAGTGWSDNRGHVWSQGMFEHYLLGGDTRSWETAKLISDWAAGPQITNFIFGNAREPGWMSKLVMSAYYATEDPFYLNAAKEMLRITHEKSMATGDHGFYYHRLPNGHCNCPDGQKHEGEAGFMLGVLMTGMKMYYDATGDETVADDIAKIGRFIVDTMWDPKEMGFRYTSCPKTHASSGSVWIMLEGLAFGARRRNDAEMAEICRLALSQGWRALSSSGKGSGYVLCNSAPGLDQLTRLPGPSFGEYRREREKVLLTPARRPVPLLVPNPGFEEGINGWPSRGWNVERCTDVKHSGEASLKITGTVGGQNEFVNTRYDAATSPMEIRWLRPGGKYELSAWLRIDRLPKDAPAPSLRIAFRDANGTRGGKEANRYDLGKMGTWQRLAVVFDVPEWNTRNYLALSTRSREDLDVEMYFDDIHVTPAETPAPQAPLVLRLDPGQATLAGKAKVAANPNFLGEPCIQGAGSATWTTDQASAGTYQLWARLDAGTEIGKIQANQAAVGQGIRATAINWCALGQIRHPGGVLRVRIDGLNAQSRVGRLVLTNVPTEAPVESLPGR